MILDKWKQFSQYPFGKWLFSRWIGFIAPYTGTIRADVKELAPGYAILTLKERRKIRNHLRSIHAVALMNLAEEASGLAMLAGLGNDKRAIVTAFQIEYIRKARGMLTARGWCEVPEIFGPTPTQSRVEIMGPDGEIVAKATATWLLDFQAKRA